MSPEGLKRSSFRVARMDCAAEEMLVRATLQAIPTVRALRVDVDARSVVVVHEGEVGPIGEALEALSLGSAHLDSRPLAEGDAPDPSEERGLEGGPARPEALQGRVLRAALAINAGFFVAEASAGWLARSVGLLGDSLDMLADAFVYAMALVAMGGAEARKRRIARLSGVLQLALAALGFVEVVRRALAAAAPPDDVVMMAVAALALAGNAVTLALLRRARSGEAHMRASVIFTNNDVIVNLGVIAAGALVALTGSRWPDLAIGSVVFGLVGWGAVRILALAR